MSDGISGAPSVGASAMRGPHRRWLAALAVLSVAAFGMAVAPISAEGRAYEMVTPAQKAGSGIDDKSPVAVASPVGDTVFYQAIGVYADTQSAPLFKDYLADREPPIWSNLAMSPPVDPIGGQDSAPGIVTLAVTSDFSRTVVRTNAALTPDAVQGVGPASEAWPMYRRDAATGNYTLLTPAPVVGSPTYVSRFIGGNEDLSEVIIETQAVLHPDAAALPELTFKVYRWADGEITLESRDAVGNALPASAATGVDTTAEMLANPVSTDASVTFFTHRPGTSSVGDLYRREGGVSVRVNEPETDVPPVRPTDALFRGATPDGSRVFFTTQAALVPEDVNDGGSATAATDLYMYTHSDDPDNDDNLTLISVDANPAAPAFTNAQGILDVSEDGSRVYFVTQQQIVDGAPASTTTTVSTPTRHLYLWDQGEVTYIASGSVNDFRPHAIENSVTPWGHITANTQTGGILQNWSRAMRMVTADGSIMLIISRANLDPGRNTGGLYQVFRFEVGETGLTCISCPADGSPASGEVRWLTQFAAANDSAWRRRDARNLSQDGSRVFFHTATPLHGDDGNGKVDVYMWEGGDVELISTGQSSEDSFFADASADGDSAFFATWEQLSGWDDDGLMDLYVARVGGGLPEPGLPPTPCAGDGCQGPQAPIPPLASLATPGFEGPSGDTGRQLRDLGLHRPARAQRARLARGRAIRLRVITGGAGPVRLVARARVGGKLRVVARARARADAAGPVSLRVRLTRPARRTLARGRALNVRFAARGPGGSDAWTLRLNRGTKGGNR